MAQLLGCWQENSVLHWLLVGSFIPLYMGFSMRLPECPYGIGAGLPQSEGSKQECKEEAAMPFMT